MVNPEDMDALQQSSTRLAERLQSNDRSNTTRSTKEGQESRGSGARRRNQNRKQCKRKTNGAQQRLKDQNSTERHLRWQGTFSKPRKHPQPRGNSRKPWNSSNKNGWDKRIFFEDLKSIFGDKLKQPRINIPVDLMEEEKKSVARGRFVISNHCISFS